MPDQLSTYNTHNAVSFKYTNHDTAWHCRHTHLQLQLVPFFELFHDPIAVAKLRLQLLIFFFLNLPKGCEFILCLAYKTIVDFRSLTPCIFYCGAILEITRIWFLLSTISHTKQQHYWLPVPSWPCSTTHIYTFTILGWKGASGVSSLDSQDRRVWESKAYYLSINSSKILRLTKQKRSAERWMGRFDHSLQMNRLRLRNNPWSSRRLQENYHSFERNQQNIPEINGEKTRRSRLVPD